MKLCRKLFLLAEFLKEIESAESRNFNDNSSKILSMKACFTELCVVFLLINEVMMFNVRDGVAGNIWLMIRDKKV